MTTVAPPPSALTRGGRTRRGLAALGAVLITLGVLAAVAAVGVMEAFGPSGALHSGPQRLSTPTAALVTDVATVQHAQGIGGLTGWPTVQVSVMSAGTAAVFVGIGPADAVDDYLSGVGVDLVSDLAVEPFALSVTRQPGAPAAAPPGEQDFWVAVSASGSRADLTWPVQDGDYRLVVMNADGSPGVHGNARWEIRLPQAFPTSVAVLVGSGLVAAAGVGLLAVGLRRGRRNVPV